MRLDRVTTLFVLAVSLRCCDANTIYAAQAKDIRNRHGGQSAQHRGSGDAVQRHNQWFADPERGWVRSDETDTGNEGRRPAKQSNQNRYRSNGGGKKF